MIDEVVIEHARRVVEAGRAKGVRIATAESCTGGLVAAALTAVEGSSLVVERGFVTYSNMSKTEMLGVPSELIEMYGAVSEPVALEMALGALRHSKAHLAISITGIAGPGGGTLTKPIGLVHFGLATSTNKGHQRMEFGSLERSRVREKALSFALQMLSVALTETVIQNG